MRTTVSLLLCVLLLPLAARAGEPPSPVQTDLARLAGAAKPAAPTTDPATRPTGSAAVAALPLEKREPTRIARFDTAPSIDGNLDDPAWKGASELRDFYQVQPGDNIAPSYPTEVLLGYDDKHLYVAFRVHDEPEKVRATVAKRDQIFDDDYVGMFFDTFNDRRKAYIAFFNPLGIQGDGVVTDERGEDYSVDIVMESKGRQTPDGWVVEASIPFKSLRYEAGAGKLWGLQVYRRIKHKDGELDSWMPLSRNVSGQLTEEGHITGLEGISTEHTLEVIPSLTISENGNRHSIYPPGSNTALLPDPGRVTNDPVGFDPGVSVKYGLTPSMTLDFTVNPDFAQVEADAPVVRANQRFPIFFEEKRPFFLEGIDIFNTRQNLVHTRTIVDPDVAVKLTGKKGRTTFGILAASDNAPGNYSDDELADPTLFPSIAPFVDKNSYIGVLRLKRDVGDASSVGLIATGYSFIGEHNYMGGFDGRFRLNGSTTTSFEVVGSTTRASFYDPTTNEVNYRTGNGLGYSGDLDFTGRNFGWNLNAQGRTRDFLADVGFRRRTNTNNVEYFWRVNNDPKPDRLLVSWRVNNFTDVNYDWSGRLQDWTNGTRLNLNFKHQTFLGFGFNGGYERVFEEEFGPKRSATQSGAFAGADPERSTRNTSYSVSFNTAPSQKFSSSLFLGTIRNALDYDFYLTPRFPRVSPYAVLDPNAPFDPGPGRQYDVNASVAYTPIPALRTSIDYTKSKLIRNDNDRVAFDVNLFSLRSTYQFTRFTFARARIDYDTLFSHASGQFLLGWTPNPGTSFYVGYNDDLSYNGFSPYTGALEPGFHRNGRTFFVKMSYLFRWSQ